MMLMLSRIKITGPVEVEVANLKQEEKKPAKTKWGRKFRFSSEKTDKEEAKELEEGVVGGDGGVASEREGEESEAKLKIMMVRTENLEHVPFQQTQELKVSGCG